MASQREIAEVVARCVAIAVFYHDGERAVEAGAEMAAEVGAVAAWAERSGLAGRAIDGRILRPLQAELAVRYGPEAGRRLVEEFAATLRRPAMYVPPRRGSGGASGRLGAPYADCSRG